MRNLNYLKPDIDPHWADSRETNPAVATAIHAIADGRRSPQAIWEDPTAAEIDHVRMAVAEYIQHGCFAAEPDGVYAWGAGSISLEKTS